MLSFLIRAGKMGAVEQVIWSEPAQLVPTSHTTLFQIFDADARRALLNAVKRGTRREDAFRCDEPLTLRGQSARMSVCMMAVNNGFLVFAAEEKPSWDGECSNGYLAVALKFMNIVKSYAGNVAAGRRASGTPGAEQTEMIQMLMGELRERKRLLEDANEQLSAANRDLNNRLVKDSLTGLVSRYQYRAEMEYLIGNNPGRLGVFVFIDIDNFKIINDRFGHAAGDRYLVEFSARLKRLPIRDTVAMRISGDEFGLFVYGMDDAGASAMEEIWRQLKAHVLTGPIHADGRSLPVALSAGMAVYGRDTDEIYELIEFADHAMYAAKRRGKNRYSVFDRSQHDRRTQFNTGS
jgi:diguanylate cyclase (GGDEF)-like protein